MRSSCSYRGVAGKLLQALLLIQGDHALYGFLQIPFQYTVEVKVLLGSVITDAAVLVVVCLNLLATAPRTNLCVYVSFEICMCNVPFCWSVHIYTHTPVTCVVRQFLHVASPVPSQTTWHATMPLHAPYSSADCALLGKRFEDPWACAADPLLFPLC